MKLDELNKSNVTITEKYIDDKNGFSYSLSFNKNVNFDFREYENKNLININTLEKIKYKDLVVLGDSKGNGKLYLAPLTSEDLYTPRTEFEENQWVFEDSVEYRELNQKLNFTKLETEVQEIKDAVQLVAEYLYNQCEAEGLRQLSMGTIERLSQWTNPLKVLLGSFIDVNNVTAYHQKKSGTELNEKSVKLGDSPKLKDSKIIRQW